MPSYKRQDRQAPHLQPPDPVNMGPPVAPRKAKLPAGVGCRFLAATGPNHDTLDAQQQGHPMNAPSELNFEDMLRIRLEVLRRQHRDLDEAVRALELAGRPDQLTLRRLKKQKLTLKDHIVKLENQLIPDIIA
jgi:hypothetical protein